MKYWAYVNNEILGPFEKDKLRELPSFSPSMLVCPQTPVGEKTEDWKEASTYPELSGGAAQAAPAPEPAPQPAFRPTAVSAPEPAQQSFPQPAIETTSLSFKPLRAAQSIDPVPPPTHTDGMADIAVNRLGGGSAAPAPAPAPAPEPVAQSSSGFDPISLSQIVRRTEPVAQEAPAPGLSLEPRNDQFQPAPAQAFEPAPAPAPAPEPAAYTPPAAAAPAQFEPENFPRAAAPAAAPVMDTAGLEKLLRRLDEISANSLSRKDIDNAVDPVRIKLDQMGEVVSSIKNSQFQREVTDKLAYLESAIGDIKTALRNPAPAAAPSHELKIERNSDTVFGVEPQRAREPEKAKPAPAEPVKEEPKDIGTKKSNIGMALKKVFKLIITLALLAAVLLGTVIGLKTFGVFDATPFIPFPLPFVSAPQQPAQAGAEASPEGQGAAPEQAAQPAAGAQAAPEAQPVPAAEAAPTEQAVKDVSPEITYIARTFKTSSGASLENKVYDHAAKAGGNPNNTSWEVRAAQDGKFEIDAVIPSKTGKLTYTFLVDRAQKTVSPSNDAAMAALAAAPPARKSASRNPAAKKAAAQKAAAKPAPAKPAPAKTTTKAEEAEEEYEYVYEDEAE